MTRFTFTLPAPIRADLVALATAHNRSLAEEIREALRFWRRYHAAGERRKAVRDGE